MKHTLSLALVALLISGCAESTSRYPSLLPRPIESRSDAEPVVAPVVATPDPALDKKLAELTKTVDSAAAAFAPAATRAETAASAAKGDTAGSEHWIAAQTALAELDGYRADTSSALTDLENLAIERAADGKPDYPAIETVRASAEAKLSEQTARIAKIQASLPGA